MEFLDFQIWTGPWIWKFGWKCGMVKDLALWIQPKNAYADAANRRDGVRERQSLDRRSISYCGGGTHRVGLRRSLRMWRRFSIQYIEVDSSGRATPRYSVIGHMCVRSERTRVPKGELTLGRYLTDS